MNLKIKESQTLKNLLRTFSGECRARNKYYLYAEVARKEGYEDIANVFEETANNEYAHCREVFNRYLKINGTTLENLKDAIMGESSENKSIYKDFEEVARREGFNEIADFYKELREVEEHHQKRYEDLANKIEGGMIFKNDNPIKWQCMNCGYIHIGKEAPLVCPLCKYPISYFRQYCGVRGE
ncbi:MAG: rubrerythrin family protein [Clostridium sp.]